MSDSKLVNIIHTLNSSIKKRELLHLLEKNEEQPMLPENLPSNTFYRDVLILTQYAGTCYLINKDHKKPLSKKYYHDFCDIISQGKKKNQQVKKNSNPLHNFESDLINISKQNAIEQMNHSHYELAMYHVKFAEEVAECKKIDKKEFKEFYLNLFKIAYEHAETWTRVGIYKIAQEHIGFAREIAGKYNIDNKDQEKKIFDIVINASKNWEGISDKMKQEHLEFATKIRNYALSRN